jgi:glycosyltransferase involved in cell wall biosynthesis
MPDKPSISICAPAFNEAEGIAEIITTWDNILRNSQFCSRIEDYEIVICDDGSSDGTFNILSNLLPNTLVALRNESNQGAGRAISHAIKKSSYPYIITIDSDGQFDLNEALSWLPLVGPGKAILGYRKKNDRIILKFGSKISTIIMSLMHKARIPDANCMLKLVDGNFIRNIELRAVGLNYSGEMTHLILQHGLTVTWMPTTHINRKFGKSSSKLLKDGFRRISFLFFLFIEKKMIDSKTITPRETR